MKKIIIPILALFILLISIQTISAAVVTDRQIVISPKNQSDLFIDSNNADTNFASDPTLLMGNDTGFVRRSIINLSFLKTGGDYIPEGSLCDSLDLEFFVEADDAPLEDMSMFPLMNDYDNSTTTWNNFNEGGVNMSQFNGTHSYINSTFPATPVSTNRFNWSISKADCQAIMNGTTSNISERYFMLLNLESEKTDGGKSEVRSSDTEDSFRWRVYLSYSFGDTGISVRNIYGNSTILDFNVTLVDATTNLNKSTTNGVIVFDGINSGIFNLTISSSENEGYIRRRYDNYDMANNLTAELFQSVVYFTSVQRGTSKNVSNYTISFPNLGNSIVSNTSNSTGGLRLYLNKSAYNMSGIVDGFFDTFLEIDITSLTVSRPVMEFYNLNVSISVFNNFNGSFLNGFSVSLTGQNSAFSETLSDSNTGNVTFSISNNTYDITIDATNFATTSSAFKVNGSFAYPNLTFSIGGLNSINFTLFDEVTDTLLVKNATILIIGASSADNFTTENGKLFVNGLAAGDYRINYDSAKFTKRDFYVTVVNNTNSSIKLYLLSLTNGTDVTFTVQDESGNKLENATIQLKRFFQSTNSYRTVAMARTNTEGKTIIDVDFNDAFYETFTTFKTFTLSTLGTKIISTTMFLTIDLIADPFIDIDVVNDVATTISFNNLTQNFKYTLTTISGFARKATIKVFRITPTTETLVCTETDTSSSVTLLCFVNTTITGATYTATGFVEAGSVDRQTNTISILTGVVNDFRVIWKGQGFFFGILIIGTLGLLGAVVSPTVGVIMFILGLIMLNFFGLTLVSSGILGFFIILGIFIIYKMKR